MFVIVMGGGKLGYYLCRELVSDGHTVSLIEKDINVCTQIAKDIKNIIVTCGDGCDQHILEDAGIKKSNVFAALTGIDEDNLIACQLAKEIFQVSRTIARVNDPGNKNIFSKQNVDVPINSTSILIKIIEEETSLEDYIQLLAFKQGRIAIIRVDLPSSSPVVGKMVREVKLPPDCVFVSILRGEQIIVPKGETVLKESDDVIALTTIENERDLLNLLVGSV